MKAAHKSNEVALKRKERLINRMLNQSKNEKKIATSKTKQLKLKISQQEKKLERALKAKAADHRLMGRIIRRNERISVLNEENTKLEFELQLHLIELENNTKVIQMEKDKHSHLT